MTWMCRLRKRDRVTSARLAIALFLTSGTALRSATPTSVTLTATANPAQYGQLVTLTAALSSASATGKVTFYNGTTVLGIAQMNGGLASLFTIVLSSGTNSSWAYYSGDANYASSKSATISETVNTVGGFFQAATSVNAFGGAIVVGDFDGDGKPDLALGGASGGGVSVLLGNGDSTFRAPISSNVGTCFFPRSLVAGDFNGDGKLDLAVGESCSGLNILLGNGDGTFQPPVSYSTGEYIQAMAAADFNGDGKVDLAVSNDCGGIFCGGNVETMIFLGNGDGTFRSGATYSYAGAIVVGDFNGDGKADLAIANPNSSTSNLNVLLGNGDGTFQTGASYSGGGQSITTADFNGDGNLDLAVLGSNSTSQWTVSVLLGAGNGTFGALTSYPVGSNPESQFYTTVSMATADFNGDGKADLAAPNSNGINLLTGRGDGTFQPAVNYTIGVPGGFVVAAAFKEDGRADLAATPSSSDNTANLSLLINTAPTPDLTIAKAHVGNFTQGQNGATYTVTVSNVGSAATSGVVTMSDNLPGGLALAGISGAGWNCNATTVSCTRSDALAASASYSPITVAVSVAASAPTRVTNTATVSGGGETNSSNDAASDLTQINIVATSQTITFPAISDEVLGTPPFQLSATASSGLTVNFISNTNSVCTASGSTVALVAIGTCSITATQGGNASYAAATPVTRSFVVRYAQTITFGALSNVTLVSPPFSISATASSGLPVSFVSMTPSACAISANTVSLVAAGTCTITASQVGNASFAAAPPVMQSFTVIGPIINSAGVVPLYSTVSTIQPGEWVSIFGSNLAGSSATWNGNFPTSLGGTTVTIDGKLAYLWFVSPGQINLQVPDDPKAGSVPVVVTTQAGSFTSTVTLASIAPSFSLLDATHVAGIILRSNGSGAYGGGAYDIIGPTGNALGYSTVAARAGDTIELFGVGLGPTSPEVPPGQAFTGAAATTNPVQIMIDGKAVTPSFAGLSSAGLYQINLTIPAGVGVGDQTLAATESGVQTQSGVVISIQ
jgi:uncharacterized protein (TIGR03437 family)